MLDKAFGRFSAETEKNGVNPYRAAPFDSWRTQESRIEYYILAAACE
jgi:hypothetical protein